MTATTSMLRRRFTDVELIMRILAALLVGKPLVILAMAALCLLVARAAGATTGRDRPMLVAAAAWLLYAGWEWLVVTRTPDANIRVDLLLIWPVLLALTIWGLVRLFR